MEATLTNVITIELNEEEVVWLKTLVQNPVLGNETPKDRKIREAFWYALGSPKGATG
jgi:hypothetical protein